MVKDLKAVDKIVINAGELVTAAGNSDRPKVGTELNNLGLIQNGAVAIKGDRIEAVGTTESVIEQVEVTAKTKVIDARGKTVMPGFVDPHTHIIFGSTREKELGLRIEGAEYLEILKAGGGILGTVESTRQTSEDELYYAGKQRLDTFLKEGVTTVESKSGYGLDTATELKQLRVANKLGKTHPADVVHTFLGAHAIPKEHKDNPDKYIEIVVEEMLPRVIEENLAEFCDVFCEEGVFNIDQSRKVLQTARTKGILPKIHADEINPLGGAELAAELGAVSADHLGKATDRGIKEMAEKGVVAVLLPGTLFFLMKDEYARGRRMVEEGVPVALSTDRNPGSSPTESMSLIVSLACLKMKLLPSEAINAATINAAHAINRGHLIGSIEKGKQADIVIFDMPNHEYLPYHYGINHVERVIKKGTIVV
ncbi:imidazolonepropionase [Natranaerobius thermophilus]|uniref:Imidazolonepropionase n=1 Tax=Natranaerobius thermophilus (strain ATCC BAA-1301 / DSM 18059 / JW/NM-WN-LF) TaxID=457570 RepID=B2A3D6_NATTJ|nr:imidazolonepropionase [Natranaerobius thermophilus]ACB86365.1 imidazolonepropionase [Natranaerobius thermophilus JW/NM-WN-LF]